MPRVSTFVACTVAALAALFASGAAQAQTESTTWYVPWTTISPHVPRGGVTVTNLAGDAVRVNVRAFNAQGAYLTEASSAFTLQPAASASVQFTVAGGPSAKEPSFALVLAEHPVLVRARAPEVIRPFVTDEDCRRVSATGQGIDGVLWCPGAIILPGADGKDHPKAMKLWNYTTLQEWPVFPIDCSNAAANHFACSKRVHIPKKGTEAAGGLGAVEGARPDGGATRPPKPPVFEGVQTVPPKQAPDRGKQDPN